MIFNSVEKLKKNKILILSLLVISSQSITANVILVFITRMVRDVFGIAETENGIASGILLGAYPFSTFLSCLFLFLYCSTFKEIFLLNINMIVRNDN